MTSQLEWVLKDNQTGMDWISLSKCVLGPIRGGIS